MRTITKNVYFFNELSNEAKEKAIENCRYFFDADFDNYLYEAKELGFKISEYRIGDRGEYVKIEEIDSFPEIARKIIDSHGENCETYKDAKEFLSEYNSLVERYSDGVNLTTVSEDNEYDFDAEADELEKDFRDTLQEDYRILMSNEYENSMSDEFVREGIEANEYEFDEDGNLI